MDMGDTYLTKFRIFSNKTKDFVLLTGQTKLLKLLSLMLEHMCQFLRLTPKKMRLMSFHGGLRNE